MPALWKTTEMEDVIEGVFSGHVDGDDIVAMDAGTRPLIRAAHGTVRFVLIDTVSITGFSRSVGGPSVAWLRLLKAAGIGMVAITPNTDVRMMGAAISVASSLTIKLVEDRAAADA